jgi:Cyclin, C-terminal domain
LYLIEIGRSSNVLSDKPPSLLAAAAVYLARATLGIQNKEPLAAGGSGGGIIPQHSVVPPTSLLAQNAAAATTTGKYWSRTLAYYTGYDVCEMVPIIRHLHALHKAAESRPNEAPSPAFTKYQTSAHYRVSLKTVRRVEDLGLVRFRTKRD